MINPFVPNDPVKRVPRKLKKRFKKLILASRRSWSPKHLCRVLLTRNYRYAHKVETIGRISVTGFSLG